jgi:L-amino acid N-acyltransferase YncA
MIRLATGADAEGMAGYAYAFEHRERLAYQWSVDVSCYVHERARRRGIGKALYEALKHVLRAQGFCNAFAGIALPNAAPPLRLPELSKETIEAALRAP